MLDKIEHYDTIAIFRHVNPDGDALGSQIGLARWIQHNYPHKTVYILGSDDHHYDIYPKMDQVELPEVFLSIVVDTANTPRVDDERYTLGQEIVKVDHHPEVDQYGDVQIVDTSRGSCCEILTDILRGFDKNMTPEIAKYLLSGILTDTIRFSTESTSGKTLESASFLLTQGANIAKLNQELFTQPRSVFELKAKIMGHVQVQDALAYVRMNQQDLDTLNVNARDVKGLVNVMSGVQEFEIWSIFVEEDGLFEGSIRSRNHTINDIAQQFGGGGHRLASGVGKLEEDTVTEIINTLAKRSIGQ